MAHRQDEPEADLEPGSRILVVEDDVLIRSAVVDYLLECGFAVCSAANASEARAVLDAGQPVDLVFTDVQMPGEMNGFALARWVKEQYPDIEVVLTSGVVRFSEDASDLCERVEFVSKPYDHSLLADRIKRLLAKRMRAPPSE